MPTAALYTLVILIWGSTWLMVKYQVGSPVAPEVSVVYRFALAAALLLIYARLRGHGLRFSARQHGFLALQGLFLFCLNYLLTYASTQHLTSGLVAVVFSLLVVFNVLFGAVFLRTPVEARVISGAGLGLTGITALFWRDISAAHISADSALGLGLALAGTAAASLGNIVSSRNGKGMPVLPSTAVAMAYGAGATLLYTLAKGSAFTLDPSPRYLASFAMLVFLGTHVAFLAYLTLIQRIGANRAGYAIVVCPLVALALSTLFEGYRWTPETMAGAALIVAGNALVMARRKMLPGLPALKTPEAVS